MKTIYYIPTVMLLVCCITMSTNYKKQIIEKKRRYIDSLTTEQFDRLRVWIETNITVGETISNLFHSRIDNKMQIAQPPPDRSLNDFQRELKERIFLGRYWLCNICEIAQEHGENKEPVFPKELKDEHIDVLDHLSIYHSSLIGNQEFFKHT